jgi:tetratricopeptide (TPR) repeat protein
MQKTLPLIIGLTAISFFSVSWNRNYAWKNNATLYESDIPKMQKCVRALYNYALFNHGNYYSASELEKPALEKKILRNYEKAIELTDRLFIVYMDLGGAYMEFGYPEKALKTFEEAAGKFGHLAIPHVQIGKYHMSFKDYNAAIPHFEKAVEMGEENADFYYLLAICQFNTDNRQDAIETLMEGEGHVPTSSAYYSLIARLYMKLEKREEAVLALNRGLAAFPNDEGLLSALNSIENN